ncbi:MAG: helix-turn-helix transcriptional regulator [Bryobacterales bacterium]|nr:helix-turn-helix transcriptional regulator [Bryobacterales bacterium]
MDVALVIRHRLKELGLEQKDLAAAAQVTESYISQLLARKKAPPAPGRTDLYDRLSRFLKLPEGELARLAELERQHELRKRAGSPLQPLFKDFRELTLRKCDGAQQTRIREIFEKEPFGALERLVTQKLLDVAKRVAREELENESWLRLVARLSDRSYEEMRVMVLEFLDTDIVDVSLENCVSFLDPLIEAWDIDMTTFGMEIVLNRRLTPDRLKRFEFVEKDVEAPSVIEPGFEDFLRDASLSADATEEEIEFLKRLRFTERRPVALYYYRELQNLRDPLHFRTGSTEPSCAARCSD